MPEGDVVDIEQLRSKHAELTQHLQNLSGEFARLSAEAVAPNNGLN